MLFYYVTLDMPLLIFNIILFQFIHEICQRHQILSEVELVHELRQTNKPHINLRRFL